MLQEIIGNWESFLDQTLRLIQEYELNVEGLQIDHIAYRTESIEEYNNFTESIPASIANMFGEAIIKDRPIGNYEFKQPLVYKGYEIPYFEVIAPKQGDNYPTGLEHLEFVVEDLAEFMQLNSHREFKQKLDKEINPEVELKLSDKYKVKFHPVDLKTAYLEQQRTGKL